jgi:TRAP-type C4-dicarboxylate transport system permease small subunit|tara:strand:+ start:357 stop:839 length:483 start_codon:yes stop_codon:yes gene_type:complete
MQKPLHLLTDGLAWLGLISIGLASVITVIDVALRQLLGSAVPGLVDLTQLAVMYSAFLGIAYAFFHRAHVSVTILTEGLSPNSNRILEALWWLGGSGLTAVLAWASWGAAQRVISYGDVSQNIGIPMLWFWLPVVAGLSLSSLGSLWAAIDTLRGARKPA